MHHHIKKYVISRIQNAAIRPVIPMPRIVSFVLFLVPVSCKSRLVAIFGNFTLYHSTSPSVPNWESSVDGVSIVEQSTPGSAKIVFVRDEDLTKIYGHNIADLAEVISLY